MNTKETIQSLQIPKGYVKPSVPACDGNAYSVFAAVKKAVRRANPELAERYGKLCSQADSYDTVLGVAATLVNFTFADSGDGDE